MSEIIVRQIQLNKKDVKKFVLFHHEVMREYPLWVPPLIMDEIHFILNGYFHDIGEVQLLMAYRDTQPVARISVQRNFLHNETYQENQGFFGFFSAKNDPEAVQQIFAAGQKWLREKGCQSMRGPMSFSIYDDIGILTDGFDQEPALLTGYTPPYFVDLLEKAGFVKEIDWYAYLKLAKEPIPKIMERVVHKTEKDPSIHIRRMNKKQWSQEFKIFHDIFNKAWESNWGHLPLTDKQVQTLIKEVKPIFKTDLTFIAEVDGKPVGFSLTLPDANPALRSAQGKLLPFGFIKLLWHLFRIKKVRTILMGILPEYRLRGLDMAMIYYTIKNGTKMGYQSSDCSLIVENNFVMNKSLEAIGAHKYRTLRIYKKNI